MLNYGVVACMRREEGAWDAADSLRRPRQLRHNARDAPARAARVQRDTAADGARRSAPKRATILTAGAVAACCADNLDDFGLAGSLKGAASRQQQAQAGDKTGLQLQAGWHLSLREFESRGWYRERGTRRRLTVTKRRLPVTKRQLAVTKRQLAVTSECVPDTAKVFDWRANVKIVITQIGDQWFNVTNWRHLPQIGRSGFS
ncbi:hypothetical protein GGX14DRAFT_395831 [Mycena pura]|uniref:Uncharacterized protein n=1 Tax=Mycena pura TaxID=153505 RepID=A0AAD6Y9J7_9AGAR|nr:hypothetical protein GGX14DRAFT_395831 [Mycena pura]